MYLGINRVTDAIWFTQQCFFAFGSDGSQLTNGRPKDVTRFVSASEYSPVIEGAWAAARVPRIACLLGTSLPVGLRINIVGRAAVGGGTVDLGGNSTTATTRRLPDGSVGVWWMFDAAAPSIVGAIITLGPATAPGDPFAMGYPFAIGEIGIWEGLMIGDVGIDEGWEEGSREAPDRRSLNDTPWAEPHIAGRYLQTSATGVPWSYVYGSASTPNLSTLRTRCLRGEVIAAVHRWRDAATGLLSSEVLAASAFIGDGRQWGAFRHVGADYYAFDVRFSEFPASPYS